MDLTVPVVNVTILSGGGAGKGVRGPDSGPIALGKLGIRENPTSVIGVGTTSTSSLDPLVFGPP